MMSPTTALNCNSNIETFAIMDLETNTLPQFNFNKANITEICINAISKTDLLGSTTNNTPRIIHKLTLLFNPDSLIHHVASQITGLDNYNLELENKFDDNAANIIISFFKHLRQPVCLVAHNGNAFDYPILNKSFQKINMQLPSNLLCIDSLKALREIDENILRFEFDELDKISPITTADLISTIPLLPRSPLETHQNKTIEMTNKILYVDDNSINEITNDKNLCNDINQVRNETTPKRNIINSSKTTNNLNKRKKDNIFGDQHDRKHQPIIKSRRVLFSPPTLNNHCCGSSCSTPIKIHNISNQFPTKNKFGYYRLENIYKRLYKRNPIETHQAEADVIMLLKILIYYRTEIIEYSEKNAVLISSIPRIGQL